MNEKFQVGPWHVRPELGEIKSNGRSAQLKPRIMELFVYLAERPGQVLSKDHLLDALWKDTFVTESTLMNAVSELRKALGDNTRSPIFIDTLSKRGYRLIATVVNGPEPVVKTAENRQKQPRVAVLPFGGLSTDPSQECLADALTDMVITALACCDPVRVISRTSILRYKNELFSLPEIVQQLNVDQILEGTLLRVKGKLYAAVRLFDDQDESIRAEFLEEDSADTMKALHEISQRVVRMVLGTS